MDLALRLLAGVLLIAANAFFVAIEFALTRLPDLDIDPDAVDSEGLRRALDMLDRLEIHLTGCQLGISTSSVLLGVVAEPAITSLIEPVVGAVGITGGSVHGISVVVAVVLLNLVHKIWGEQAPTYLGVERPEAVARRLAPILSWWSRIMHPIIKLGDGLAKWTLRLFGVEITRSWAKAEKGEDEAGDAAASDGAAGTSDGAAGTSDEAGGITDGAAGTSDEAGGITDGAGGLTDEGAEITDGGVAPEETTPVRGRADLKRRMARLLSSARDVPADRQEEVMQALQIDEIPVSRIMVPANEIVPLVLGASSDDNRARLARTGFVRYPVVHREARPEAHDAADPPGHRDPDASPGPIPRTSIAGVVYVPRLFDPPERLRGDVLGLEELLDEPVFVEPSTPVAAVIDRLQNAGQEVALVVEDDHVTGMVTVTDALEAIAGEVSDPLDAE